MGRLTGQNNVTKNNLNWSYTTLPRMPSYKVSEFEKKMIQ